MPRPVRLRLFLGFGLAAGIADQNGLVPLPCGLEAEIVVDAAVAENDAGGEWRPLQIEARARFEVAVPRAAVSNGDSTGGNADEAATACARGTSAILHHADAVVAHVELHETPQRAGLDVGGVDHEARLVGQVLQRLAVKQVLVIRLGNAVADAARQQRAQDDGFRVDRDAGEGAQRLDEFGDEMAPDAIRSEAESRQASASWPAVIDPPETLDIRLMFFSNPVS